MASVSRPAKFLTSLFRLGDEVQAGDFLYLGREAPAWLVSLLIHVLICVSLALLTFARPALETAVKLTTSLATDEVLDREIAASEQPLPDAGALSAGGTGTAMAGAVELAPVSLMPVPDTTNEQGTIQETRDIILPSGPRLDDLHRTRGVAGMGVTGAAGAVDRITQEILRSLEQEKTLVVWVFDRTISVQQHRDMLLERLERVYKELGVVEATGDSRFRRHMGGQPLLTSVVSFAEQPKYAIKRPTDNLAEIREAVANIETDDSGIENVFGTIQDVVRRFMSYRQPPSRNVMIVVFTDEAGDDVGLLDKTVQLCQRHEMPVYVVGATAPFGRRDAFVKWVDPDPNYSQEVQWAPVSQGPESLEPELLQLLFADSGPDERYEALDSGFGPYGLTRLCFESGGIYFAVHPNRRTDRPVRPGELDVLATRIEKFFDTEVMRPYRPDYVSASEWKARVLDNAARGALLEAARMSWLTPMERPITVFPFLDEADFAARLRRAQQSAAKIEPRIRALEEVLKQGEADRPKLDGLRWQAGYDLAMGRVLAVKVRTEGYNTMLAMAKSARAFENPENDTWELRPADTIESGSRLEKDAAQAKEYLERVVRQHPGTPWAEMAQRELKSPLGWKWEETFTGVRPREQPNPGTPSPPRPAPPPAPPPPRRDPPRL